MAYSDSVLPKILEKSDRIWADNQVKSQFDGKVDAALHLIGEQTARVNLLLQGKDRDVEIAWINACNVEAEDCVDACTIGGNELTTDKATYAIETCKQVKFKVPEKTFRDNLFDYTEVVATGMMKGRKELDEQIAQAAIAALNANSGVNAHASEKWTLSGTPTGSISEVAPGNFDLGLMFHMQYAAAQNRFSDPFLLSGFNLAEAIFNARMNAGNDSGKGDAMRASTIRVHQDFFNLEAVNTSGGTVSYYTYMVDKGAIAFASKNYYNPQPRTLDGIGHVLFSVPSMKLPGVVYDVTHTVTCTSGEYYHEYKLEAHFDWFINPTGCINTRTGILRFLRTPGV